MNGGKESAMNKKKSKSSLTKSKSGKISSTVLASSRDIDITCSKDIEKASEEVELCEYGKEHDCQHKKDKMKLHINLSIDADAKETSTTPAPITPVSMAMDSNQIKIQSVHEHIPSNSNVTVGTDNLDEDDE